VPAGKAIALAAMPTAVLMGMGFTPTLAQADDAPTAKSLTADEYKDCLAALDGSASPSASASPSSSAGDTTATPSPSASSGSGSGSGSDSGSGSGSGGSSSSDSGSDAEATPTPSPSASASKQESSSSESSGSGTVTPSPSASASDDGNLLTDIGDAITGIFTGGSGSDGSSSASPTPTPSASASKSADDGAGDTAKDTTEEVTDTVKDTVKDTTDKASKAADGTTKAVEDATKAAQEAAADATASPSPSASPSTDPEDCPAATDEVGDTEPNITVADKAWTLKASSLLLKGADYQGVVKVRTASGKIKKVLKYVISDGTEIGDLHQIVTEGGKTYHVQAGKGMKPSTITGGKTIMYTESISGNLLGLIPLTFTPDSPPPLNIPTIYFTNVTVQQAAQYGGTLTVPGMKQYSEG
jgi:flagellar hook-basal body complex protein FliE